MRHDTQNIAGDSDVWAFMPGADTQRSPFGNIQFHTAKCLVADVRSHLSLSLFLVFIVRLILSFVPTVVAARGFCFVFFLYVDGRQ